MTPALSWVGWLMLGFVVGAAIAVVEHGLAGTAVAALAMVWLAPVVVLATVAMLIVRIGAWRVLARQALPASLGAGFGGLTAAIQMGLPAA